MYIFPKQNTVYFHLLNIFLFRYEFPRFFSNQTIIANPLPTEIDEKTKNSIMKDREIILKSVKRGLDKLAKEDETYDEKMDGDEENNDENDIPTIPNSVQASKFLEKMCFVDDESETNKNQDEKLSDDKSKKSIIMALENFKNALTDIGLFKELDQDNLVNIYQNCLTISEKGRQIVLKRKISQRNINNYNKLFHSVWQANTDIQLCLDTHAVISYISDYVTKSDNNLTKVLVHALNEKKNASKFEQLNHIKRVYFNSKQTCVSEAAYRLIPGLNLKDSNIKTLFLTSGFPENRRMYFRQIPEDERQDEGIEIEGREGKFHFQFSKIDLYSHRPKDRNSVSMGKLEDLCFAEFCMNYDKVSEDSLPKKKYDFDIQYEEGKEVSGIAFERKLGKEPLEGLPQYFYFFYQKGKYIQLYCNLFKYHKTSITNFLDVTF